MSSHVQNGHIHTLTTGISVLGIGKYFLNTSRLTISVSVQITFISIGASLTNVLENRERYFKNAILTCYYTVSK